jgi:Lon-like protease
VIGLGGVAVVMSTVTIWQLPAHQFAERPGPLLDLAQRITIGDDRLPDSAQPVLTPIDGSLDGLTVVLQPLTLGDVLMHRLTHDDATIVTDHDVKPPELSSAVYHALEKAEYIDGGQVAAAVAERQLGHSVSVISDGLRVVSVAPGSAAEGLLVADDVVTAADGTPINTSTQLQDVVDGATGHAIDLTVRHDDGVVADVEITPTMIEGSDAAVLGIIAVADHPKVDLPIPVTIDATGVEGPSAGLMTALTIYDELSSTDLVRGRTIAGTGTLAIDGTVGEIGGIQAKARAALAAGADLFLAPADQAADARAVLGDRIPVLAIATFAQAIAALTSDVGGPTRPS